MKLVYTAAISTKKKLNNKLIMTNAILGKEVYQKILTYKDYNKTFFARDIVQISI